VSGAASVGGAFPLSCIPPRSVKARADRKTWKPAGGTAATVMFRDTSDASSPSNATTGAQVPERGVAKGMCAGRIFAKIEGGAVPRCVAALGPQASL